MPDKRDEPQAQAQPDPQPAPPPTPDLDETHPGGRFLVNGQLVNAGGQPFDKDPDKNLQSAIDASKV